MYMFILCVPVWLYALNVARQTTKTAKTQANCQIVKGVVSMAPKQGLCMSDTTAFKKGWDRPFFGISDVCMLAGVHVYACVDMYARFRNAWGPALGGNTCF